MSKDTHNIDIPGRHRNPLWRYAAALICGWTVLVIISLFFNFSHQRIIMLDSARIQARALFDMDILYRRWNAKHGGLYVPVTDDTPPNPYLEGLVSERDVTTQSGKKLTLINPSYMTRQVHELGKLDKDVYGHITSLNPIRNAPDDWERDALTSFEKRTDEVSSIEIIEGKRYMRLMRPIITEKACLKCHEKQGYIEGDIRGGISISVPIDPFVAISVNEKSAASVLHFVLWLTGSLIIGIGSMVLIRKEEKRGLSEENLKLAIETANIGSWIRDLRTNSLTWSKESFDIYGIDHEKEPTYDDFLNLLHPDDLETVKSEIQKAVREKRSFDIDYRILRPDMTEKYVHTRGRAIYDKDGEPVTLIGMLFDITETKKTTESLAESEDKFRTYYDKAPLGYQSLDENGCFIDVNETWLETLQYSRDEVIGRSFADFLAPGFSEKFRENFPCFKEAGEIIGTEFEMVKKDGSHVIMSINGRVGYNEKGDFQQIHCILNDITERNKLEDQLHQSQKMETVGQLAGGMAHDFNNILAAIINYGHLLQIKTVDEEQKDIIEKMLNSADRAARLTTGLLAFSRKQIMQHVPLKINELIGRVEHILSRLIGEHINIKTVLTAKDSTIMADSARLEQVLMNLATNARDAMPEGGILTIETKEIEMDDEYVKAHGYGEPGKYALVSVSDTGKGMDEETKNKIFEPFFTTKEVGKGTGLGLSMSYGIIKQHNGFINVYSEEGKGTTFKIYLPVTGKEAEEPGHSVSEIKTTGTETVLLAEDDGDLRKVTKQILEASGYKVIEAVDGEDAVEKYNENKERIQLLVFDSVMPKMTGEKAYDEIRKSSPDIKILFISGYTEETIAENGVLKEGLNFISKPVSPKELLQNIREILNG